jgi:hypothetical protein
MSNEYELFTAVMLHSDRMCKFQIDASCFKPILLLDNERLVALRMKTYTFASSHCKRGQKETDQQKVLITH